METTPLWDKLIDTSLRIESYFDSHFDRLDVSTSKFEFDGWKDSFWHNEFIRKCHLKTIDRRKDKKLWLMHINIFPREDVHLPILGFDIVAGPNKVTGAFFDYSVSQRHPYLDYLEMATKNLSWNKPRELPEWAQKIFSSNMIAAGNIRDGEELQQLITTTMDLIENYVENIAKNSFRGQNLREYHNLYCKQQKKNPHLHNSILSLGVSEHDKDRYVNEILFEEI
jgi:hypothetical protein